MYKSVLPLYFLFHLFGKISFQKVHRTSDRGNTSSCTFFFSPAFIEPSVGQLVLNDWFFSPPPFSYFSVSAILEMVLLSLYSIFPLVFAIKFQFGSHTVFTNVLGFIYFIFFIINQFICTIIGLYI